MEENEDLIFLFDKAISKSLNSLEEAEFTRILKTESGAKSYQEYLLARQAIHLWDQKQNLKSIEDEIFKNNSRKSNFIKYSKILIAACLIGLIITFGLHFSNSIKNSNLIQNNVTENKSLFQSELIQLESTAFIQDKEFQKQFNLAKNDFDQLRFSDATIKFNMIQSKSEIVYYYLSLSQLKIKDLNSAKSNLKLLLQSINPSIQMEAKFYLALIHYIEDKDLGQIELKELLKTSPELTSRIQSILK